MCGIIGYTGYRNALPVLLDALKRLEYRGYDSAGVSIVHNNKINIFKEVGEISNLEKNVPKIKGTLGIGHTRWATHGEVNKTNAHPHLSNNKKIAIIHNGIIDNYKSLREELTKKNYKMVSETDSEIFAHLVEDNYKGNLEQAVLRALKKIKGSYAFVVTCAEEENKIVVARKKSPIVIGLGEGENFVASDIPALLRYTDKVYYLDDEEVAVITNNAVTVMDLKGKEIKKEEHRVEWNLEDAQKAGYSHFMLKEIFEQPKTIHQTFLGRISELESSVDFGDFGIKNTELESIEKITILACGTSFYAGLVGKYIIEKFALVPVSVEVSSEYNFLSAKPEETLIIAISQSGETADTLSALRRAKGMGCKTLAITNIAGSTISRISNGVIYNRSGIEIGVAATKTFTSQLIVLFLFAIHLGIIKGNLGSDHARDLLQSIKHLPRVVQQILDKCDEIAASSKYLEKAQSVFYIGRNINYPISLEGALKLKEISYIHAEGFAAGELKHGPFALLTKDTPVVAIAIKDDSYDKMLGNIGEIKARKSPVICIADEQDKDIEKYVDNVIRIPSISPEFSPIPTAVVCQLLAYYIADKKGRSIDKPRNLAKSVTVE